MTPRELAEQLKTEILLDGSTGVARYMEQMDIEAVVAAIERAIAAAIKEEREAIGREVRAFVFDSENRDERFLLAARLIEKRIRNRT